MDRQIKARERIKYEEDGTLVRVEEAAPGALIHLFYIKCTFMTLLLLFFFFCNS